MSSDQVLLIQTIINGLLFGCLFGVISMGLSLTWGLLKIANFAHLSFALLAAYMSYTLTVESGWDPLATMIVIVPVLFVIGAAVQWVFERFQVNTFTSLLLTFGMFIVLENLMTFIWSADTITSRRSIDAAYRQAIRLPEPFDQLLVLPPDLMAFIAAIILGGAMFLLLRYTLWGRAVRAMAEDPVMARAFGVNYLRNALILAGIATATAGVAGVIVAVKMPLYPSLPLMWIGKVVAAVILGGLGNPIGAIVAACALSIVENVWSLNNQPSLAPLISFSILIAVLVFQPRQLFDRLRGRLNQRKATLPAGLETTT